MLCKDKHCGIWVGLITQMSFSNNGAIWDTTKHSKYQLDIFKDTEMDVHATNNGFALILEHLASWEFILQYTLGNADSKCLITQIVLSANLLSDKTNGFSLMYCLIFFNLLVIAFKNIYESDDITFINNVYMNIYKTL